MEGHVAQPHAAGQSTAAELARTPSTDSQGREAARADTPEAASDRDAEAEAAETKAQHRGRSKDHKLPPGVPSALLQSHAILPASSLYMHPSALSATICIITLRASICTISDHLHYHSVCIHLHYHSTCTCAFLWGLILVCLLCCPDSSADN